MANRKPYSEARCDGSGQQGREVGTFYLRCPSCNRQLDNKHDGKVPPHTNPLKKAQA